MYPYSLLIVGTDNHSGLLGPNVQRTVSVRNVYVADDGGGAVGSPGLEGRRTAAYDALPSMGNERLTGDNRPITVVRLQ